MPGVVTFVILGSGADPVDPPLARHIRWGARETQMAEEFAFVDLADDGAPLFDYALSRAGGEAGPALIGVYADGSGWYYDPDGAAPGEEADTSFDGDALIFTTRS